MPLGIEIRVDALRTLAFGSISGTYEPLGVQFANPMVLLMAQNFTDVQLTYSFDGITDHFVLPSGGQVIFDAGSDKANNTNGLYFSTGTQMYVKGSPTTGNTYITTMHQNG